MESASNGKKSFPMPWRLVILNALLFFSLVVFYTATLDAASFPDIYVMNFWFMLVASLGILSYGAAYRRLSSCDLQRLLRGLLTGYVLSALLIVFYLPMAGGSLAALASLTIFLLTFGCLSGFVYHLASRWVPASLQGRYIGTFLALSNMLLFLYEELTARVENSLPAHLLLFLSIGIILWMFLRQGPWGTEERPLEPHLLVQRHLPLCLTVTVLLSLLMGLDDAVSLFYYDSYRELFAPSRPVMAAGYLLAGWLADWHPAYLPLTALLGKAVTMAFFASALEGDSLVIKSYAESLFSSFLIVFIIRLFLEIAVRSRHPAFFAGMGRAIEMPFCAIGALVGVPLVTGGSPANALLVYALLLILIAALFYRGLILYFEAVKTSGALEAVPAATPKPSEIQASMPTEESPTLTPLELEEAALRRHQESYNLTPREVDVLREILAGRSIAEMAGELHITQRTAKYHIGNLLRKTGTKNQWELRRFLNMNAVVHAEDKL